MRHVRYGMVGVVLALPVVAAAEWKLLPETDQRTAWPDAVPADAKLIQPGKDAAIGTKFRWAIGELTIPESIDGTPTRGRTIAMKINGGDGGEVHVDEKLMARFDNDHPALVVLADRAEPGSSVRVGVQFYAKVQGGETFDEAQWVLVDDERSRGRLKLTVHGDREGETVPNGIVGLSQGGGVSDYDDATAAKLREGGFKWFRMDNVFTPVVRKGDDGKLAYDWSDLDRRVDFLAKIGADAIIAASYMPIPFDAVENHDRQSAPKDYALWEDLCYRAAKRCLDRGRRVPFWEVWNEVNTGWLKPGPEDKGDETYRKIYNEARGEAQFEEEVIRRFEAYCKLYRATVQGVRRADPKAKFGGPALASGPFENQQRGHCFHGKGFARGLMSYCVKENLPLDFVSWHEYFQPVNVFAEEADAFRGYLRDYPEVEKTVESLMITEWNEAWWADRPMDHEIGAAWCADCVTRAFIPKKIDRPCLFYVKQNDTNFRGDFSILMRDNVPKATFNAMKMFNGLSGRWLGVDGGDDDVSAAAAWDAERGRLAVILVNFRDRYALRRHVRIAINPLPAELRGGTWREWLVDATHSNVWHDRDRAELEPVARGDIAETTLSLDRTLMPNSVTMIEVLASTRMSDGE